MSQVFDHRSSHSGSSNEFTTSIHSQPFGESTPPDNSSRLQSFTTYPPPHNVSIFDLAKSGFMYVPDPFRLPEVHCVGCRKVVETWNIGDDPSSLQFHEPYCHFTRTASHHSGSSGNENLYRASGSNVDEQTKPLETTESMSYEPYETEPTPFGRHRKHGLPYRDAFSLPPDRTDRPEFEFTRVQSSKGNTNFSHVAVRSSGARSHSRRSASPSPSSVSSYSSYHPGFLAQRSLEPSLSLPHSSIPQSEQDLLFSRLENPPTLQEMLEHLNLRNARDRLYTFERFWSADNIFTNYRLLVICGFYCLGQGDAVECFCCHIIIANWSRNDNPRQRHIEMSPRCRFMKGEDTGDVPLALEIRTQRRGSPNYSESTIDHHSPARSHHSIHSHHSSPFQSIGPISQPSEGAQAAAPEVYNHPTAAAPAVYNHPTQAMQELSNRMDQFPCLNPSHASMREEGDRLRSFNTSEFRRYTSLGATNQQLAEAGLYYTGPRDRTACWFCNGGLENFEANDIPWEEHAKYYPQCEYLKQQKGPAWVDNISRQHPNIVRPPFPRRVLRQVVSSPTPLPYPNPVPPVTTQAPSTSSHTQPRSRIEDPQQMLEQRDQLLEQAMQSEAVLQARHMGFTDERIRQVQMQAIINTGSFHHDSNRLTQALLNRTGEPDSVPQPSQPGLVNRIIRLPGQTIRIRSSRIGSTNITGTVNGVNIEDLPSEEMPPSQNYGSSGSNVTFQNGTMLINGRTMEDIMGEAFSHPFFSSGSHSSTSSINISGANIGSLNTPSHPSSQHTTPAPQCTPSTATSAPAHGVPGIIGNLSYGRGRRLGRRSTNVPTPAPAQSTNVAPTPEPTTTSSTRDSEPSISNPTNANAENEPSSSTATGSTEQRLDAMVKERRCKICLTAEADILFQPCGHICACAGCSDRLQQCPVCRRRIYRYTRVYHA